MDYVDSVQELAALALNSLFWTPKYEYTSIAKDEIRILYIQPGHGDEQIECEIMSHKRTEDVAYKALSYCWGTDSASCKILVQGSTLYIRNNLFLALQQIRDPNVVVSLWTDALCINQSNNDEKASQVTSLDDVYRRATDVIIWLGENNILTARAFELLAEFERTRSIVIIHHQHGATIHRKLAALSHLLSQEYL